MHGNTARIRLIDGQAEVQMGAGSLRISRRDIKAERYHCPLELVAGALGS